MEKLKELALLESNKDDETLWEDEWLAVKSKDGWYTYTHSIKSDGKGVAVLGYTEDGLVLGRYENTPPHGDGITLASLTGMVEKGDTPLSTAVKELKEEAGLDAEEGDFIDLGTVRPSKSSDTVIYCFGVELKHQEGKLYGEGDGTKGEEGAYCEFLDPKEAVLSKDPLLSVMICRMTLELDDDEQG